MKKEEDAAQHKGPVDQNCDYDITENNYTLKI